MADDAPPPKKKKKLLKKSGDSSATPTASTDESVEEGGAGGSKKGLIIMAAVGLLMLGIGVGVGVGVSGMLAGDTASANQAAESDGESAIVEEPEEEYEEDDNGEKPHSIYVSVGKLLASVDYNGTTRYIQAEVDLVSYDQETTDEAVYNMPAIRNRLLLLFSSQKFDEVRTVEGREKLRADTVVAVNEALGLTNKRHKIEDAYFTAFVIQ